MDHKPYALAILEALSVCETDVNVQRVLLVLGKMESAVYAHIIQGLKDQKGN